MNYDIVIIGGGAAGMCTAIKAKTENNSILIIEHNERVGKKILSTGNGRCNLTNMFCVPEYMEGDTWKKSPEGLFPYFTSGDRSFVDTVITAFDADDTVGFFAGLGLMTFAKDGYVYPRAAQASVVLDILRFECERKGVEIITGYQPLNVKALKDQADGHRFKIDDELRCRNLVLATGGMSAPQSGSDGSGYEIAKRLGHKIIAPLPALCGIKCSDDYFKNIAGVRSDGRITLFDADNNAVISAFGNLQFNRWGISGIPVFQISSEAARRIYNGEKIKLRADLMPDLDDKSLADFLNSSYMRLYGHKGMAEDCANTARTALVLNGLLNKKIAWQVAVDSARMGAMHAGEDFGTRIVPVVKRFRITPTGYASFDEAQTTSGGADTNEIDPDTMQSRIISGLFFAGEIMDVNGICGGYNLQWAWSTAHIAAEHIKEL